MEKIEKTINSGIEAKEVLPKYYFEEMAEIEPAVIEVVAQLKDAIEKGEYDALISDDAGGRVPTLILRKIFKQVNPNKDIWTLFVAAGHSLPNRAGYYELDNPFFNDDRAQNEILKAQTGRDKKVADFKKLEDYLNKFKDSNGTNKALVVTQFIRRGASMGGLLSALKRVGIETDVAALEVAFMDDARYFIPSGTKIFWAPKSRNLRGGKSLTVAEEHEKLSGVEKSKEGFSPIPVPTRSRKSPLSTFDDYLELRMPIAAKLYGDQWNDYHKRPRERVI